MTAEQKIQAIEAQMRAVLKQETNVLNCPFCGKQNKQPSELTIEDITQPLCCPDFALATEAVIMKFETEFHLDAAERIAEGAATSAGRN